MKCQNFWEIGILFAVNMEKHREGMVIQMSRMEQRERREQRELLLRFLLCTIAGLGTGALIGYPTTPTIAVSAILMLYIDRGYTGSMRYSWRRVRVQILMGGLALVCVLLLQRWTPLPGWGIGMITAMIIITIGLPLQEKYHVAPLTVTMGNAALIMTTGVLGNVNFYWQRVLFCVLGAVIAHLVNFLVLPRADRYQEVCKQLEEDAHQLAQIFTGQGDAAGVLQETSRSEAFLEKHIGYLKEDGRWKRHRLEPWCYAAVAGLLKAERKMLRMGEDLSHWHAQTGEDFQKDFQTALEEGVNVHLNWVDRLMELCPPEDVPLCRIPMLCTSQPGEAVLAADVIHYIESLNDLRREVYGAEAKTERA